MNVALPKSTFDNLINYLSKCPFIEVENLVNELRANVKPITITPPPVETPKEVVDDVQSESNESKAEAPTEQTVGEEANNQETQPDNQGQE